MAFAYVVNVSFTIGAKKIVTGSYTNAVAGTGGDIDTGLSVCESFVCSPAAAAVTNAHVANETFPVSGGVITIITANTESGCFVASGIA